jgi:hypothetical protein
MFLKKLVLVVGFGLSLSVSASDNTIKNYSGLVTIKSFRVNSSTFYYQNDEAYGKKSPNAIENGIASPIKASSTACFVPESRQPIFFIETDSIHGLQKTEVNEWTPLSKAYAKGSQQKKSETSTSCCQKLMSIFCCCQK